MANLFNGDDSGDMARHSLRGQLLFEPGTQLQLRVMAGAFSIASSNTGDPDIDEGNAISSIKRRLRCSLPAQLIRTIEPSAATPPASLIWMRVTSRSRQYLDNQRFKLTSISGFERYDMTRSFDADQLNLQLLNVVDRQDSTSLSQELRIAAAREQVEWLAGIYYYDNDFRRGDPLLPTAVLGAAAPLLGPAPGVPFGQPGDAGFFNARTTTEHLSRIRSGGLAHQRCA